jgi:hypothetical protein
MVVEEEGSFCQREMKVVTSIRQRRNDKPSFEIVSTVGTGVWQGVAMDSLEYQY